MKGNDAHFEVGNYLGGGATGTVYEAEYSKTKENFAMKILNPLGYKLVSPTILRKCTVLIKGKIYEEKSNSQQLIEKEHVWWLINSSTKQHLVAYYSERDKALKELTLKQCIRLYGTCFQELEGGVDNTTSIDSSPASSGSCSLTAMEDKKQPKVPIYPPKFVDFVRRRLRIFREITNMRKISNHRNVIRLQGVLELVQESKCTIFLVMELANGGELFDRIKLDYGTREDTAKGFFKQLLDGVRHCHEQGVCHRDLKPENLLLSDTQELGTILKIADFGFSARCARSAEGADLQHQNPSSVLTQMEMMDLASPPSSSTPNNSSLTTLISVVGSPFYVAPEILEAKGYSGPKADVWSIGVILYAILAGNLPFGQELTSCKRYKNFCKWIKEVSPMKNLDMHIPIWEMPSIDYPLWLFPSKFSSTARNLIVSMLHPDPQRRISVTEALKHPFCDSCLNEQLLNVDRKETTDLAPADTSIDSQNVASSHEKKVDTAKVTDDALDCIETDESKNNYIFTGNQALETIEENEDEAEYASKLHVNKTVIPSGRESCESSVNFNLHSSPSNVSKPVSINSMNQSTPPIAPIGLVIADADRIDGPNMLDMTSSPQFDEMDLMYNSYFSGASFSRQNSPSNSSTPQHPPNFSDSVKRSTRFITSVPAFDVLQKIMQVLETFRANKSVTGIGVIGKVELYEEAYRIEVWGHDGTMGPPIMAMQVYQMPRNEEERTNKTECPTTDNNESFLVEFIRGQLEIFAFKRFYQEVRQEVEYLVKSDYALSSFQAGSPMITNSIISRFS